MSDTDADLVSEIDTLLVQSQSAQTGASYDPGGDAGAWVGRATEALESARAMVERLSQVVNGDPRIAGDLIEVAPNTWISHLDAVWTANRQTYLQFGKGTMVTTIPAEQVAEAYRRGCELRSTYWRQQRTADLLEAAEREARGLPDTP